MRIEQVRDLNRQLADAQNKCRALETELLPLKEDAVSLTSPGIPHVRFFLCVSFCTLLIHE